MSLVDELFGARCTVEGCGAIAVEVTIPIQSDSPENLEAIRHIYGEHAVEGLTLRIKASTVTASVLDRFPGAEARCEACRGRSR